MSDFRSGSKNNNLLALTAAALALPGINPSIKAATAPTETTLSYRFSNYQEDDIDSDRVNSGDTDRYNVDVHQLRIEAPTGSAFSVEASLQREILSGASPWATEDPDADGEVDLIMSGASIREQRTETHLGVSYYYDEARAGISIGNSDEDDYQANSIGIDWETDFNERSSTFNIGFSYSDDRIDPQSGALNVNLFDPVDGSEDKESVSLYFGIGQVIDRNRVIQTGINLTDHEGYLSDPYKLADQRPDSRQQVSWILRYRQFIPDADAAMHLDYRYYSDDWSIESHTLSFSWYQNLEEDWQLVPFLRYYSQTEANFYNLLDDFNNPEDYFSSDHTLSQYGAVSGGLRVVKRLNPLTIVVSGERYEARASYALDDSDQDENPALVSYTRITFGFDYTFD